jgi:serine/threonine-protein kinase
LRLPSGSYLVIATSGELTLRHPLVLRRAARSTLTLTFPDRALPGDLCIVPGGQFIGVERRALQVGGFAMARFPVTLGEYTEFLDAIGDPKEREARLPRASGNEASGIRKIEGRWTLAEGEIEGEALARVRGNELRLPVGDVSWYDALAYARWLGEKTNLPFRLPTDLEWDKAMRGADGRTFPMGNRLDPSFAKLRESRPEASQPEPVGAFALDESPYGVRDMAGGIGDWTSTMVDGLPPPAIADEGTAADSREAVWRGGAWSVSVHANHTRFTQMLHHRVGWVGFRLALSLDSAVADLVTEPMKR